MRDVYHAFPIPLGHAVLSAGFNEPLIRDEIYCQVRG